MAEPYLGEIRMVGFTFPPVGWAFCNGQLLSIAQNTALFALLGTTYGGNGTTTFALPDFRGRVPIHFGSGSGVSSYVQGATGGVESVTMSIAEMPSHNHKIAVDAAGADSSSPSGAILGNAGLNATDQYYSTAVPGAATLAASTIGSTGGGSPLPVVQPFLVVNFIIALQGIFPSRN